MWGDRLNAASAGARPMTPSSVAGASQRIVASGAPPTNSIFDADDYIIRDYADLTPPPRRKRAHGGPHVATPWLLPLRKRVALESMEKGADRTTASSDAVCATASSDAVCATASSDVVKPRPW